MCCSLFWCKKVEHLEGSCGTATNYEQVRGLRTLAVHFIYGRTHLLHSFEGSVFYDDRGRVD